MKLRLYMRASDGTQDLMEFSSIEELQDALGKDVGISRDSMTSSDGVQTFTVADDETYQQIDKFLAKDHSDSILEQVGMKPWDVHRYLVMRDAGLDSLAQMKFMTSMMKTGEHFDCSAGRVFYEKRSRPSYKHSHLEKHTVDEAPPCLRLSDDLAKDEVAYSREGVTYIKQGSTYIIIDKHMANSIDELANRLIVKCPSIVLRVSDEPDEGYSGRSIESVVSAPADKIRALSVNMKAAYKECDGFNDPYLVVAERIEGNVHTKDFPKKIRVTSEYAEKLSNGKCGLSYTSRDAIDMGMENPREVHVEVILDGDSIGNASLKVGKRYEMDSEGMRRTRAKIVGNHFEV
ncbi:hypothetical protein AB4254_11690 [Vibrio breoganii]